MNLPASAYFAGRVCALPESDGTCSDANCIAKWQVNFACQCPDATGMRVISSAITCHVDVIERAMLRRKIPQRLIMLHYCNFLPSVRIHSETGQDKAHRHPIWRKMIAPVISVDYFVDHWYPSPKARTGKRDNERRERSCYRHRSRARHQAGICSRTCRGGLPGRWRRT